MQGKGGSRGARRTVHLLLDLGCPYFHVGRCGGAVRSIQSTAACSSSHSVRSSLGRPIGGSSAAGQEGASGQSITTPPAPRAQPFATLVQPAISKQAQRAPHHHHETNPQAATLSFDNHPHFSPSPTSHPQHQRLDQQSAPNALECSLPSFSSSSSSSSSSHATPTPSAHAHDSGRSTPSAQHRPEDRRDDGTSSNRTATANVEQSSCHITQTTTPASPATGEREHEWGCKYFDINGRQKRHMPPRGHPHHHPEIPKESFFRRELPKHCVSFSSDEGKKLFREALEEGFMDNYFTLAAQYRTQSEPAFCGLGTLTMALNSLSIDPGRVWKGPWRWFSEEMLDCCTSLEVVKKQGITLGQFVCLARCNGAKASLFYGSESNEKTFRQVVEQTSRASDFVTIVSYNRAKVGQTGTGHFSPIGGYHKRNDMVLLMEVARFKYPPHWIPLPMLFEATKDVDAVTGRSRGFVTLSASEEFCFWCNNSPAKH